MYTRDFFILATRLLGIYFFFNFLTNSGVINFISFSDYEDQATKWGVYLVQLLNLGFWIVVVIFADRLVDLLKMTKGFQTDRLDLNQLKSIDIAKIGLFILGALMFVENFVSFASLLFYEFKTDIENVDGYFGDKMMLTVYAVNTIVGYLLFTYNAYLAQRFFPVRSSSAIDNDLME